jgi:hypothetical protein
MHRETLTDDTVTVAVHVAMYLSQVMVSNHRALSWKLKTGSKRNVDYGHPVLVGFKDDVPFNPIHLVVTLAHGLARGSKTGRRLREIYDTWERGAD